MGQCKRRYCGNCHSCKCRQRAAASQRCMEAYTLEDQSTAFEEESSSYCTTSMTSERSDTTSVSEPDIPELPLDPSIFREPYHKGKFFKHFLLEEERATVKWHRCRFKCDYDPIEVALDTAEKAVEIVRAFERCVNTCGWALTVVVPRKVRTPPVHGYPHGRIALLEKFIPELMKVNSNSGWTRHTTTVAGKLCQSISHFSYVFTKGELVLCNFRVHINRKEKLINIVSPEIITRKGGVYGYADIGLKGVRNFFCYHTCNGFCSCYAMPRHIEEHFPPTEKTILL